MFDNVFSIDNIKCFLVLFVNRVNNTILMCTTRGDRIDCNFFKTVSELHDRDRYFGCTLFRFTCQQNDEVFVLYLADLFTTGDINYIERVLSDNEITERYKIYIQNDGSNRLTEGTYKMFQNIFRSKNQNNRSTYERVESENMDPENYHHQRIRGPYSWFNNRVTEHNSHLVQRSKQPVFHNVQSYQPFQNIKKYVTKGITKGINKGIQKFEDFMTM